MQPLKAYPNASGLDPSGLTELKDAVPSQSKHNGGLSLGGLTKLMMPQLRAYPNARADFSGLTELGMPLRAYPNARADLFLVGLQNSVCC